MKPQDATAALKELVGEMNAGKVDMLIIMGSNPVYDAPADFAFCRRDGQGSAAGAAQRCTRTKPAITCTGTSPARTTWSSGATRAAFDGTASLIQPLIAPLYNGKSEYEFIFALVGSSETPATTSSASTGRAR